MAAFDTNRNGGAGQNSTGRTVFFFDALTGTAVPTKGRHPAEATPSR